MKEVTEQSQRDAELAYIAMLEEHQEGRRARLREIQDVIDRKQLAIDNRRARLNKPPAPERSAPPRGLTACP